MTDLAKVAGFVRRGASRALTLSVILMGASAWLAAQQAAAPKTEFGGNLLAQALDHMHNLEYDTAQQELRTWLQTRPNDLPGLNYLATNILHRELFKLGLLQLDLYGEGGSIFRGKPAKTDPEFDKQFLEAINNAIHTANVRLKRNAKDDDALYWAGAADTTLATYEFTVKRAYFSALRDGNAARSFHARLYHLDPSYTDCLLVLGLHDYIVGSLPFYIKVLAALAGHRGNRVKGLQEIEKVSQHGHWAEDDATLVLAVLYNREKKYPEMLATLRKLAQENPRNYLLPLELARAYEREEDWQGAAKTYGALIGKYQNGQPNFNLIPVAQVLYEDGRVLARFGDPGQSLMRYEQAGSLPGKDIYIYRADLAAANIYASRRDIQKARVKYQIVAEAVPNSEEGRAARRALKTIQDGPKG
ncbi:MAG: tetratricopeptide repeat protein [Terriglobia bacterium]